MPLAAAQRRGADSRGLRVDDRTEELTLKLDQANAKVDALQTIVALLLRWEDKQNPVVLSRLRKLAAGDVPELVPDLSIIPSNLTPVQRAHVEANLAKHWKATKVAIMELATTYSLLLGGAKRGYICRRAGIAV